VSLSENVSIGTFIEVCYGVYDDQGQASNFLNTVINVVEEVPTTVVGTPGIYWADGAQGTIYGSDLDGTNVREIVTNIGPWDIAVDPLAGRIYWTDRNRSGIYGANLDGTNVEEIVSIGRGAPGDILIDLVDSKLYWTNSVSKIQQVNLDGTNLQDVLTTGPGLDGIALDAANEKVYWTEWTAQDIRRANLDGTAVETVVSTGVRGPAYVGLDVASGKMYLLDHSAGKILRANLDGTDLEELLTGLNRPSDMVLDLIDRKMYWTLHHDRGAEVWWADLDGTNVENIVNMPELGNSIGMALSHLLR
jgi:low density lipoprotein receptor-related protein 5/6